MKYIMAGEAAIVGAVGGIFIIIFLFWILAIAAAIAGLVFWIFMIVDVAKRQFKNDSDKTLWILIVILAGVIGAIIYYFVIKRPDKH